MPLQVKIREVARAKGITTAYQLQKLAGLHPPTASRLFKNSVERISIETLEKLCDALDCEASELFVRRNAAAIETRKSVKA